jgi:8-oxo-dGTP pyrophosphatase MutT (NUDIX family)
MEKGEALLDTAIREGQEEVNGLKLTKDMLVQLPTVGHGATTKTLETGEKVWCKMEFNHFEVHLDKTANQLTKELQPGDDLVKLRWFSPDEIRGIKQIPGGREFFIGAGYI